MSKEQGAHGAPQSKTVQFEDPRQRKVSPGLTNRPPPSKELSTAWAWRLWNVLAPMAIESRALPHPQMKPLRLSPENCKFMDSLQARLALEAPNVFKTYGRTRYEQATPELVYIREQKCWTLILQIPIRIREHLHVNKDRCEDEMVVVEQKSKVMTSQMYDQVLC
jgi:hypothetical protein